MLPSMNTIADIETLYARLGERDYEAVMSYLADDIVWIVADNSPLADRSPYHGIAEVRSGVFERLTVGFDKLVFDADEIFECNGGERVVALGYYYFRFHGQVEERKAQVAPTSGRSVTAGLLNSSNTSTRSTSHATRERSKAKRASVVPTRPAR
jgi:ketosteroid isomerase-like protein